MGVSLAGTVLALVVIALDLRKQNAEVSDYGVHNGFWDANCKVTLSSDWRPPEPSVRIYGLVIFPFKYKLTCISIEFFKTCINPILPLLCSVAGVVTLSFIDDC